jgi:hypothetical protein
VKRKWRLFALVGLAAVVGTAVLAVFGPVVLLMVNFPDPPTSPLDLPSGGRVEVIAMRTPQGESAVWELEYRTHIGLSNRRKLADEVSMVWQAVAPQAQQSGASRAVIRPVSFSRRVVFDGWKPAVQSHEMTAFSYVWGANGRWLRAQGWPKNGE